ncbi:DNA polymerase III subunit delta' [soil metagenome]
MFSRLVGNENVKLTLRRLTASGRMPNSMLLSGDEGVGKRQFAIEIAKSFVCKDPVDGEACDLCAACRRADKFVFPKPDEREYHERIVFSEHPDVGMVIPYNRNILIKAIRHLESEANYRPYEAEARIFIIDDADKMNDPAANALLKTLEEPSPTTYIFLVTSRPDKLLPTIRSRCQSLRFSPITSEKIEDFLINERAFTHDEARLAARLARGSIGRAVTVNVEEFRKRREKMMGAVTSAIQTGGFAALLKTAEELNEVKDKSAFEENLNVLQSIIHDVWTLSVTGDQARLVNTDFAGEIGHLAKNLGQADLPGWMSLIDEVRENLKVNINRKIAADALFVSMAGV